MNSSQRSSSTSSASLIRAAQAIAALQAPRTRLKRRSSVCIAPRSTDSTDDRQDVLALAGLSSVLLQHVEDLTTPRRRLRHVAAAHLRVELVAELEREC